MSRVLFKQNLGRRSRVLPCFRREDEEGSEEGSVVKVTDGTWQGRLTFRDRPHLWEEGGEGSVGEGVV